MKKRIVAVLLCGLMAFSLAACAKEKEDAGVNTQADGTDAQEENKKEESAPAQMKYRKQVSYDSQTGKITTEIEEKFDEKGRQIYYKNTMHNAGKDRDETAVVEYSLEWVEDGNKCTAKANGLEITHTYDKDGNLIEKLEERSASKMVETYTYKNGKKTAQKTTTYLSGEPYMVIDYLYDDHGNPYKITQTVVDLNKEMITEYAFKYDKAGKILTVSLVTDGEVKEGSTLTYIYDGKGYLDKVELAGVLYQDYTNDEHGNCIDAKTYNGDKVIGHAICEYYEK